MIVPENKNGKPGEGEILRWIPRGEKRGDHVRDRRRESESEKRGDGGGGEVEMGMSDPGDGMGDTNI